MEPAFCCVRQPRGSDGASARMSSGAPLGTRAILRGDRGAGGGLDRGLEPEDFYGRGSAKFGQFGLKSAGLVPWRLSGTIQSGSRRARRPTREGGALLHSLHCKEW